MVIMIHHHHQAQSGTIQNFTPRKKGSLYCTCDLFSEKNVLSLRWRKAIHSGHRGHQTTCEFAYRELHWVASSSATASKLGCRQRPSASTSTKLDITERKKCEKQ